jgi:TatA/E family protein of Tat protein translocase
VGPELLLLILALIVVLVWRGPSTLPRLGEAAGKAVKSLRRGMQDRDDDEAEPPGAQGPDARTHP